MENEKIYLLPNGNGVARIVASRDESSYRVETSTLYRDEYAQSLKSFYRNDFRVLTGYGEEAVFDTEDEALTLIRLMSTYGCDISADDAIMKAKDAYHPWEEPSRVMPNVVMPNVGIFKTTKDTAQDDARLDRAEVIASLSAEE